MQKSAQLRQKNTLGPRLARLITDCLPILCWDSLGVHRHTKGSWRVLCNPPRKLVASAATCVVEFPMEDSIEEKLFLVVRRELQFPASFTVIRSTVEDDGIHF